MRARLQPKILIAATLAAAAIVWPRSGQALVCSVLDEFPCVYRPYQQECSVFDELPCTPELQYPFSQQLRLTIESRDREARDRRNTDRDAGEGLGTIRAVFATLRSCWVPPAKEDSRPGAQLSVRLSFKRSASRHLCDARTSRPRAPSLLGRGRGRIRALHAACVHQRARRRARRPPVRDPLRRQTLRVLTKPLPTPGASAAGRRDRSAAVRCPDRSIH